jgi:putative transcriptional regulator
MQTQHHPQSLTGKLLIAMPGMGDPRFDHSVVFLCAHSTDGAMGLIINKPTPELEFEDLLTQLKIPPPPAHRVKVGVHYGGPVEGGRGFVLHSSDYAGNSSTLKVDDRFGMTATLDVLEDLSDGAGPRQCILALGYAGWGPGQLESELRRNGWLTCDAETEIVFDAAADRKWHLALASLGIDPMMLSATGGRA